MNSNAKIFVAGHRGMVGSALVRKLQVAGYSNLVTRSSSELDLREPKAVRDFFQETKPEYVFLAAAKVGGIVANNTYRAEFLYDNLMIQNNVIHESYRAGVTKLLFLGSSCIYPKLAPQPLKEDYLLTGLLEPTNEPYAIAKIAGIKMCDAYRSQYGCHFISAMPTNLYGPNDNYDLKMSHVIPALLRKFHEAKVNGSSEVVVWGTGTPLREFMHVDDLAEACLVLMERFDEPGFINVGTGVELSVRELAELIARIVGFKGRIVFDTTIPDGTPRKLMDVSRINRMGWKHSIDLEKGLREVFGRLVEKKMANNPLTIEPGFELMGKCPLCASVALKEVKGYSAAFLKRCARCRFVFSDRKASTQELLEHYGKYPRDNAISSITIKRYQELLDRLEDFRKTANLLDVGCGDGHFLAVAKDRGWKVHGTEYTAGAVNVCSAKGIEMFCGSLPSAHFDHAKFDVITSFEVIEHLQQPREEARAMFSLLRPGGACYLTTPNFNSATRMLLGPRWNVIEYPEHLGYFTRSSLTRLFADSGFRQVKSVTTGFSLDRAKAGWMKDATPTGLDESIRQQMERNSFISTLKNMANFVLNITSAGDSLKTLFIKP